jgi:hypothetical protein
MLKNIIRITAAAAIATVALAPTAQATPVDQVATALCGALSQSGDPDVIGRAMLVLTNEGGLTTAQAARFVIGAVNEYCPDNAYLIDQFIDQNSGGSTV